MMTLISKLPLSLKIIVLFSITLALMGLGSVAVFLTIKAQFPLAVLNDIYSTKNVQLYALSFCLVGIVFLGIYIAGKTQINQINTLFKQALAERRLDETFPEFYSATQFSDVLINLRTIFSTFKSLDHLKAGRVSLEVNTVKLLTNHISEGVIMVNKDKVVTHINSNAESLLKLIPGEIVGQSIVRKITNTQVINLLDQALVHEEKITNIPIKLNEQLNIALDVLPIHDKFGVVIRAMLVIKQG